jgi:hypothetical protein
MATEYVESVTREAPEIEARKLALMDQAKSLYGTALNLPAYQAAGLAPTTMQAIDLATQGVGAYQPYLTAAGSGIAQGQNLAQAGARGIAGINVAPEFAQAQQAQQQGLAMAGQMPAYAQTAGLGYGSVAQGMDTLQGAVGQAGQYNQANLAPSQGLLSAAAQQTAGVDPQFGQAQGTIGQGIGGLQGSAQGYDPNAVAAFMNPYQQLVTQQAMQEMRRQADIARASAASQAVRAGAFGGTREGVQRAETERGVQDIMSQRILQDYAQNYGQAQQAALGSFEQQQQRQLAASQGLGQMGTQQAAIEAQRAQLGLSGAGQLAGIGSTFGQQAVQQAQLGQAGTQLQGQLGAQQAQMGLLPGQIASTQANIAGQGAQLYGQLGQGIGALAGQEAGIGMQQGQSLGQLGATVGQLGVQQGALGQAAQQMGMADVSALTQLGAVQQQNQQAQLEAARATQLQQAMSPYQQLGFVSDIYRGAPSSSSTLTAQTAPSVAPAVQAVGLGVSGLTAAAGAQKLFG